MPHFEKRAPKFTKKELAEFAEFDFLHFRTGLLKEEPRELEKRLRLPANCVTEWEKRGKAPKAVLNRLREMYRLDYRDLAAYERARPAPFHIADAWRPSARTEDELLRIIGQQRSRRNGSSCLRYLGLLERTIRQSYVKPKLALLGCSDAGKSTLINALMNQDKLPASYQPTTSILVYIKHLNERPAFIRDEVWIFRAPSEDEDGWNPDLLFDEDYTTGWKLEGGSADLLYRYGTHDRNAGDTGAGCAVLFAEADILANCDLVDSPGICSGNYSRDKALADQANVLADIVVYASTVYGFMGSADQSFLRECIQYLPAPEKKGENRLGPLCNLFILATHAFELNYGGPLELISIQQKAWENFCRMLPDTGYFDQRSELTGYAYGNEAILGRMFPFATDREDLHSAFYQELREVLTELPPVWGNRAGEKIRESLAECRVSIQNERDTLEDLLDNRNKYERILNALESSGPERAEFREERRAQIMRKKSQLETSVLEKLKEVYDREITPGNIQYLIGERKCKNTQEDIQALAAFLSGSVKAAVEAEMTNGVTEFLGLCKSYLDELCGNIPALPGEFTSDGETFSGVNMDYEEPFGLTGWMSLAWFASIMGASSSLLATSSMLITAPIVTGILLAAGLLFQAVGKGWKKAAAKNIAAAFEKKDFLSKMENEIHKKWEELGRLFLQADDEFDRTLSLYTEKLKKQIHSYNPEQIRAEIDELRELDAAAARMEECLETEARAWKS